MSISHGDLSSPGRVVHDSVYMLSSAPLSRRARHLTLLFEFGITTETNAVGNRTD